MDFEELFTDESIEFSEKIDRVGLQDSFQWRFLELSKNLATFLIDASGKVNLDLCVKAAKTLKMVLYPIGSIKNGTSYNQALFREHLLYILQQFQEPASKLQKALARIFAPADKIAQALVRQTLHLSQGSVVHDAEARRAALSALMLLLRQNIGSCFATAPAILIQQELPSQFLQDIDQLFSQGAISRIISGIEYRVPLSPTAGMGDLLRPISFFGSAMQIVQDLANSPSFFIPLKKGLSLNEEFSLSDLIRNSGLFSRIDRDFVIITPESIFESILLCYYELDHQEVEEYKVSRQITAQDPTLFQAPMFRAKRGAQIEKFFHSFDQVKKHFVALTDHPVLKAWEFTLASLSESTAFFAKQNLTICLGLDPKESGGLGQRIQSEINERISNINEQMNEVQAHYDAIFFQAKSIETRMRSPSSDQDLSWLRADYQVRKQELDMCTLRRDHLFAQGIKLRELLPFLVNFIVNKFQEYFQEIYDPQMHEEMHELQGSIYDDSPAGFRLLYKHGRKNPSSWTLIYTMAQYQESLIAFFIALEVELSVMEEMNLIKEHISKLFTICVVALRESSFLASCFDRLSRAYHEPLVADPLNHLARIRRKPWAYISGGGMTTLLSCYFSTSEPFKEQTRWIENESELLAFYLDTMRSLPHPVQESFLQRGARALLAFSPTHAFSLHPGWERFSQGWLSDQYSYTYIRDQWVVPSVHLIESILLGKEEIAKIISEVLKNVPLGFRSMIAKKISQFSMELTCFELREKIAKILSSDRWLRESGFLQSILDELDGVLHGLLPFFYGGELEMKLLAIFENIYVSQEKKEKLLQMAKSKAELSGRYQLFSSLDLLEVVCELLREVFGRSHLEIFWQRDILKVMRRLGFALLEPVMVGDTNWSKYSFGFCVNPGTLDLEFWRFDLLGVMGKPMSMWKSYLDGRDRGKWGILIDPTQYH